MRSWGQEDQCVESLNLRGARARDGGGGTHLWFEDLIPAIHPALQHAN